MTVDWSKWMSLTEAEQKALWAKYRDIVAMEIARAKLNNWQRLTAAIYGKRFALVMLIVLVPSFALAQPACVSAEDRERVRAIMLDAIDAGLKQHSVHIFDNWLKDPTKQPERAERGMRNGVQAYIHSRTAVLAWTPPTCGRN